MEREFGTCIFQKEILSQMKGMTPGSVADVNFLAGRTGMNHMQRLMSLTIQVITPGERLPSEGRGWN
jgi:hypothetical protein